MKRALIIGIQYPSTDSELRGTVNDCLIQMDMLQKYFGFKQENITFLTDAKSYNHHYDKYEKPTKQNIIKHIKEFTKDVKDNDVLFFHYSGHGIREVDVNHDEISGFDEVLCPCDYEKNGYIVDDDLHELLIASLPANSNLFCVMDCCHSGTILDMPYSYSASKKEFCKNNEKTVLANVIMISGCNDSQTSDDIKIGNRYYGALTAAFNNCLCMLNDHKLTHHEVLLYVTKYMEDNKYTQRPCINTSSMDLVEKQLIIY